VIATLGIRNIGVISSANLEFGPGFTALTGETGAGKTMVLTALGLLLGARADSSTVRRGSQQLLVEGRIFSTNPELLTRLQELGCDTSEDEILINRTVSSDGRSRAAIGGTAVPVSVLEEITSELVTIHGQSEQIRLRSPAKQREALDSFGGTGLADAKTTYLGTFREFQELRTRIERMRTTSETDQLKLSALRLKIADIAGLESQVGELTEVEEQIHRLSNVESLRSAATKAHDALSSEDGSDASEFLAKASKSLESTSDPDLRKLAKQLSDLTSLAGDISGELASYLADLDADPQVLDRLLGRKAELVAVERRYGVPVEELLSDLPSFESDALDLDSSDEQIEKLETQLRGLESKLQSHAAALTAERLDASSLLSSRVSEELAQLAMSGARLEIQVTPGSDFDVHGADKIEFLLAAHSTTLEQGSFGR
jgi:DNA repair protein RecN (Recombination protein N)